MKSKIFKSLAVMLGVTWIVLGVFVIIRYGFDQPLRFVGAIAIIGAGIYFINYAVTGRATLVTHHLRQPKD